MNELWDTYWNEMRQEWFKLEVLQDYSVEDDCPSLRYWLNGDKKTSLELLKTYYDPESTRECKGKTDKEIILNRMYIVSEPYIPYIDRKSL